MFSYVRGTQGGGVNFCVGDDSFISQTTNEGKFTLVATVLWSLHVYVPQTER